MKKKLSLDDLQVKSFVTRVGADRRGGVDYVANPDPVCGASLCPPCTEGGIPCTQTCDPDNCRVDTVIGVDGGVLVGDR